MTWSAFSFPFVLVECAREDVPFGEHRWFLRPQRVSSNLVVPRLASGEKSSSGSNDIHEGLVDDEWTDEIKDGTSS